MLRHTSSACFEPITGSGCSGLPLQFRPDLHACALELSKEVVTRGVRGEDVVEGRDVHRRQEASGVEFDAGKAELDRPVSGGSGATFTSAPELAAVSATAARISMLCTPSSNEALRCSESAGSMPATSPRKARAWQTKPSFCSMPTPGASIGRPPA